MVYWTKDEELQDDSWKNSEQLFYTLNISGASGGTKSEKGAPVVWSELQNKTSDFPGNKFLEKSRLFAKRVDDNAPYDIKNGAYHPKFVGEWSFYEGRMA